MEINYLDLALMGLITFFTVAGAYRGALVELAGLVGIFLGVFLARNYTSVLAPYLSSYIPANWLNLASFILIIALVYIIINILARILTPVLDALFVGIFNRIAGGIAGALKAIFICIVLTSLGTNIFPDNTYVKTSQLLPYLKNTSDWIINIAKTKLPDMQSIQQNL